jgi:hypothetical protein
MKIRNDGLTGIGHWGPAAVPEQWRNRFSSDFFVMSTQDMAATGHGYVIGGDTYATTLITDRHLPTQILTHC